MISTLLMVGFQWGAPTPKTLVVEPEAATVIDAVKTAYANLQTIRFTMSSPKNPITRSWEASTGLPEGKLTVAYRRNLGLFVQACDPSTERVLSEYRELGRKIILSSPNNHYAYVRNWIRQGPPARPAFSFPPRDFSPLPLGWYSVANQGQMIVKTLLRTFAAMPAADHLRGNATIRMGDRGLSDGVPIDRVILEETYCRNPGGEAQFFQKDRTVYGVGVKDRLLRRIEWSTQDLGQGNRDAPFSPVEMTEFQGVLANQPIPEKTFHFQPSKSMSAIDDRPWDSSMGPKVTILTGQMKKAVADLRSLSFVSDLTSTRLTDDGPATTHRTVTRFDIARPLLAYGEVSTKNGAKLTVVCDGQNLQTRGGKSYGNIRSPSTKFLSGRIRNFDDHSLDGQKGTEIGCGADLILRQFFESAVLDYSMGLELEAPRKVGTETFDVLTRTDRALDDNGLPSGDVRTDRYLVGRADHLIHGYESDSTLVPLPVGSFIGRPLLSLNARQVHGYEWFDTLARHGKIVVLKSREWLSRLEKNPQWPPSKFQIKLNR